MIPSSTQSVFQVRYRLNQGQKTITGSGTAFCVELDGEKILVTARHVLTRAQLGPELGLFIRGEGAAWSSNPQLVKIITHPVGDLCLIYAPTAFSGFTPLPCAPLRFVDPGVPLVAIGHKEITTNTQSLPKASQEAGCMVHVAAKPIRAFTWVSAQTNIDEFPGMSGSPIVNEETGCVVGVYSRGWDRGTIIDGVEHVADI